MSARKNRLLYEFGDILNPRFTFEVQLLVTC